MIRNDKEHREAVSRLVQEQDRMRAEEKRLDAKGYTPDQVKRLTDPMRSFHQQLIEDVEAYERLLRGEFADVHDLHAVGQLLVAARIAQGLSQRKLAELLNVDESQVSRDERNAYHGVTIDRAARILDVLGVDLMSRPRQRGPLTTPTVDA